MKYQSYRDNPYFENTACKRCPCRRGYLLSALAIAGLGLSPGRIGDAG